MIKILHLIIWNANNLSNHELELQTFLRDQNRYYINI